MFYLCRRWIITKFSIISFRVTIKTSSTTVSVTTIVITSNNKCVLCTTTITSWSIWWVFIFDLTKFCFVRVLIFCLWQDFHDCVTEHEFSWKLYSLLFFLLPTSGCIIYWKSFPWTEEKNKTKFSTTFRIICGVSAL